MMELSFLPHARRRMRRHRIPEAVVYHIVGDAGTVLARDDGRIEHTGVWNGRIIQVIVEGDEEDESRTGGYDDRQDEERAMRLEHDPRADALYIKFNDKPWTCMEDVSLRGFYERGIDYAEDATPIGVEFLNVSRGVDLTNIPHAEQVAALLAAHDIRILAGGGLPPVDR